MMQIDIVAWLGILLRWFHIMAGIMWIGTSFYFIWLGNALRAPKAGSDDEKAGVEGELWAVHGGGFYHKKKYKVAPDFMPEDLHWFKWEAYLTFISGMLLLALVYYYAADLYLIDHTKMMLDRSEAILIGLGSIVGAWIFYDMLCKSDIGKNNGVFGVIWFCALTASTWALDQVFTGRGAFIHVGAMIGTVMAVNVFAIIIPNQKKAVAALLAGVKPDPRLGKKAGQRSLHNNYMTLPVLLVMISNHYPVLFGHEYNWLVLAGLSAAVWPVREFFNQQEKGRTNYLYLVGAAFAFVIVIVLASYRPAALSPAQAAQVPFTEVKKIVRTHCVSCHSDTPTHDRISEAPLGVMFDTAEQIKAQAPRIIEQAVDHDTMPLGNETNMTAEERGKLGVGLGN